MIEFSLFFILLEKLKIHTRDLRFKQVRISKSSKIEGRENRLWTDTLLAWYEKK